MLKIISLILVILLLSVSIAFAKGTKYDIDSIMKSVKENGETSIYDSIRMLIYLEYHDNDRDKTHTSYYLSTMWMRVDVETIVPVGIVFIKEHWNLKDNIWTVSQSIAKDDYMAGEITGYSCNKLVEELDGLVLEYDSMKCELNEQDLVDEVIAKTRRKLGI